MVDISLNILDIAVNSVKAGASLITVHIIFGEAGGCKVIVTDNGCGIDGEKVKDIAEGKYKGHGLDRLREAAEHFGGEVSIESQSKVGTVVTAQFPQAAKVDNIGDTVMALAANDRGAEVIFKAECCDSVFRLDTRDYTGGERVTPEIMLKIKRDIQCGLKNLSEDLK